MTALEMEDEATVLGNWTAADSDELNKLYTKAVHESTKTVTAVAEADPLELNISICEQKRLNRANPARQKVYEEGVARWKQQEEQKWKSQNAREVASLREKVCTSHTKWHFLTYSIE